jgi:hypothetical protein
VPSAGTQPGLRIMRGYSHRLCKANLRFRAAPGLKMQNFQPENLRLANHLDNLLEVS